ncbi:uncharacterized protein V1510DRAFT_414988 [Dipodascopsis tothii]|uniref:uncharacterized protein n=1 Tax=Dipodascopsis tothii TaxID=44089 RepID=UPI0034CDE676
MRLEKNGKSQQTATDCRARRTARRSGYECTMAPKKSKASLTELLEQLTVHSGKEEHEHVLDVANKMLRLEAGDERAVEHKLIALIKLERYAEAVEFAKGHELGTSLALERAYCLYQVGELAGAEALVAEALAGADARTRRGLLHLRAQVAYKAGEFATAAAAYGELGAGAIAVEHEDYDISVNEVAIAVQRALWGEADEAGAGALAVARKLARGEAVNLGDSHGVSHEQAYNYACVLVAAEEYADGLALLKRAKALAQQLDGYTDDEIEAETLPINMQAAYVHGVLGHRDEAVAILNALDLAEDGAARVVVTNNLLALSGVPGYDLRNPHVALRLLTAVPAARERALTKFQRKELARNQLTLEHLCGKENSVKKGIKRHLQAYPADKSVELISIRPGVLDPYATGGKHTTKNLAYRVAKKYEREPTNVALGLAAVQLMMKDNNTTGANKVLDELLKLSPAQYPALRAVAGRVYQAQGHTVKAVRTMWR